MHHNHKTVREIFEAIIKLIFSEDYKEVINKGFYEKNY